MAESIPLDSLRLFLYTSSKLSVRVCAGAHAINIGIDSRMGFGACAHIYICALLCRHLSSFCVFLCFLAFVTALTP